MTLRNARIQAERETSFSRRLLVYLGTLALCWGLFTFVLIPLADDDVSRLPENSFKLIEGQRAYAMLLRLERPTLAASIRGLHMVGAVYTQEKTEQGRVLLTGNVRLYYDQYGEFLRLELLDKPE
ncbi:MAG: hypothetical protein LBD82_00430 [Deltaproteobacteria bacterium]|jgi:hypothetical protein|nr:hypothetical protein [Deltaproteobacteria bacterium]